MKIKKPSDSVGGGNFVYADLPKSMDECFYEMKLVEFKLTQNEDKFAAVFECVDTDTKVRPGQEISVMLDPSQKFAETYFWRDLYSITIALRGKSVTAKRLSKYSAKYYDTLVKPKHIIAFMEELIGSTLRLDIVRFEKDGEPRTAKTWSAA